MSNYKNRVIDRLIERKLLSSGAILLRGPRYVGKTTTAINHAKSSIRLDESEEIRMQATLTPNVILRGETPRLIDEWQLSPNLWNQARIEIDNRAKKGQFIFTGSASPDNSIANHTGAGRFARLFMRPMTLFESGNSTNEVNFANFFEPEFTASGIDGLTVEEYIAQIVRGGWPNNIDASLETARDQMIDYVSNIVNVDFKSINKSPSPQRMEQVIRSLSQNIATEASLEKIAKESSLDETSVSTQSVREYLDLLSQISVLEELPAWQTHLRSKIQVRVKPKWHFIDPSIATASLRASSETLLNDLKFTGFLFESMAIRDIRVYCDVIGANVYHYRDATSLEIDAIVQRYDGKWLAVEIKLGGEIAIEEAVVSFKKLNARLTKEKLQDCAGRVILTAGKSSYTRQDGIHVVSLGHLYI